MLANFKPKTPAIARLSCCWMLALWQANEQTFTQLKSLPYLGYSNLAALIVSVSLACYDSPSVELCSVCLFRLCRLCVRVASYCWETRTTCQLSGQPHRHVIFQPDCALEPSCSIKTVSPCTVMCTVNSLPQGHLVTSWKFSGKWLWQLAGYPPQLHAVYRTRTARLKTYAVPDWRAI